MNTQDAGLHGSAAFWRTLIGFEVRSLVRDRAFLILLMITIAAAAFGTANGVRWAKSQQAVIDQLRADENARLEKARDFADAIRTGATPAPRGYWNHPGDSRGFAYYLMTAYAMKPPAPLAPLAVGQSDLLPYHFKVNAGSQAKALAAYDLENPRYLRLGRFDLSFVVIFLLPLVLLAAAYDVLTSERESGRLTLLVLHGVTPGKLVLMRLALRAFAVEGLLLASVLCALLLTGFEFGAPGATEGLWSWTLITVAYAAFWSAVAVLVICVARTSSGAALGLAGSWLVLVVLLPWCMNLAARTLYPPPSRPDYVRAMRDATDAAIRDKEEVRGRFLNDHPELTSAPDGSEEVARFALNQISSIEYIEAQLEPVAANFDKQLERQQALVDRWQWLSPAVLTQQALNEVAGTSAARHQSFLQRTGDYIAAIRRYFNPRLLAGQLEFAAFDDWPRYAWHEPESGQRDRRLRTSLIGILIPTALLALAGFALVVRVRPLERPERMASA